MTQETLSAEEICRRGSDIYENQLRTQLERDHHGEYVAIDIHTGEYEVDDNDYAASKRLRTRVPGATVFGERIGYRMVFDRPRWRPVNDDRADRPTT